MDINQINIEDIVKQVMKEMVGSSTDTKSSPRNGSIPKTSRVAMLTGERKIEVKEFKIPEISEDEILVKVEGCGICGTDVHEYKGDPFGLIPVVLGHEGSGEIVKIGKNVKRDTAGKAVKLGDKLVSCVIPVSYTHLTLPTNREV